MNPAGPVAVTGAGGRLGRAVVAALRSLGVPALEWRRPDFDLDSPVSAAQLIARDRPQLVIHCAAWTDVEACAREPALAMARNAGATEALAVACEARRVALVLISTNEVFDGSRTDGRGYTESDAVGPINAYGRSKLAAEEVAKSAFGRSGPPLWIVRTSWLFGPPGNDFPAKIVAAADLLGPGEALRVVDDEFGCPTYTADLAPALVGLVGSAPQGIYHLAAPNHASRHDLASAVLGACRPGTPIDRTSLSDFQRQSQPPPWSVLDSSLAAAHDAALRPWHEGLASYLDAVCAPKRQI